MCVFIISQNAPLLPHAFVLNYDGADFLMDYDFSTLWLILAYVYQSLQATFLTYISVAPLGHTSPILSYLLQTGCPAGTMPQFLKISISQYGELTLLQMIDG